jgi:hypothetical protein
LLFGSLVIPFIFADIQNSQKELEIKTGLIKEMNPAIMDPIMMVQVLEQERRNDTKIDLGNMTDEAVLTDERVNGIKVARLIESQLRAFFPYDLGIARDWNNIFAAAFNFVNLYLDDDETKRENLVKEIYRLLAITPDSNVTEHLKSKLSNKDDYRISFFKLQDEIKWRYDNLTRLILTNPIPEYRCKFPPESYSNSQSLFNRVIDISCPLSSDLEISNYQNDSLPISIMWDRITNPIDPA